jgi:4-amino-4-deoxy-L-arabinose transferase-like glycosyltransferase
MHEKLHKLERILEKYTFIFLLLTVLLGFLLRFYLVTVHPPLDVDEYSVAYNAYSIATTGKDEWGASFPLFFRAFGDYKLAFDIYTVAAGFVVFGVHDLLIRLPSVIWGTLSIILTYSLIQLFFQNKKLSFFGSLLMALSPYTIYFSRIASGSISQFFFTFLSIVFFLYYVKKQRFFYLIISVLALIITLYTYPSSWIISPLIGIYMLGQVIWQRKWKYIPLIIVFYISFMPVFFQFFYGNSSVRLAHTSFWGEGKGSELEINELRGHEKNSLVSKIFFNKATQYTYIFATNYIKHFDLSYLIFAKEYPVLQSSIYPPLYFIFMPFYFYGLYALIKKKRENPLWLFILFWIIIAPLPSAITDGAVNSKRYLTFLGSDILLILLGLQNISLGKKPRYLVIIFLLFCIQIGLFFNFYYNNYVEFAKSNLYFKANALRSFIKENYTKSNLIAFTTEGLGEPQIYPLYSILYSPEKYIREKKFAISGNFFAIQPFDKFEYAEKISTLEATFQKDMETKKNIALLSTDELKDLDKEVCYDTITSYTSPDRKNRLKGVLFKPCQP